MIKKRKLWALAGSVGILGISAFFPPKAVTTTSVTNEPVELSESIHFSDFQNWINELDTYIQNKQDQGEFPGLAVTIVKNNEVAFLKGYGYAHQKAKTQVDEHTVFRLASTSKGFASALAGVMVNEGSISWDDQLVNYIPEFELQDPNHAPTIHLKHILSHTAGFPYHMYTNLVEAGLSMQDLIPLMKEIDPIGPVGKYYAYQNAGYSLIGEVMTKVSGKSYSSLLQEKIFQPLQMQDASSDFESLTNNDNVAFPHYPSGVGWRPLKQKEIYYNAVPAGGVNASISDMAEWLKALLGYSPGILPPHILNDIYTPRVSCPVKWKYFRNWKEVDHVTYGLGWRICNFNAQKIIYHGGYIDGFRSEIAFDPEQKIGICILSNGTSGFPKDIVKKFLDDYKKVIQKT